MNEELKIRSMIVSPPGHVLVNCDFSQAESWIVAFKSGDPRMKQSLQYGDIHTETAANIILFPESLCQHTAWTIELGFPWKKDKGEIRCIYCNAIVTSDARYTGKRINHGTGYRMFGEKQAEVINKDSDKPPYVTISIAQSNYYNARWKAYYSCVPGVWWPDIEERLRINRTITTCYGHRYIFNGNWGDELFRTATAFEPQSTVAQHANGSIHPELGIRGGFLEVFRQLYKREKAISRIINVSHDSILFECPTGTSTEVAARAVTLLRRPIVLEESGSKKKVEFTIPVDCEIGDRWGELEKIKVAA